jgi:hypothetical protein
MSEEIENRLDRLENILLDLISNKELGETINVHELKDCFIKWGLIK